MFATLPQKLEGPEDTLTDLECCRHGLVLWTFSGDTTADFQNVISYNNVWNTWTFGYIHQYLLADELQLVFFKSLITVKLDSQLLHRMTMRFCV